MKCPNCGSALVREEELYGDTVDRCAVCARRFPVPVEKPLADLLGNPFKEPKKKRRSNALKKRKTCRKCGVEKSVSDFYTVEYGDGRRNTCKTCEHKYQRAYSKRKKLERQGEAA